MVSRDKSEMTHNVITIKERFLSDFLVCFLDSYSEGVAKACCEVIAELAELGFLLKNLAPLVFKNCFILTSKIKLRVTPAINVKMSLTTNREIIIATPVFESAISLGSMMYKLLTFILPSLFL